MTTIWNLLHINIMIKSSEAITIATFHKKSKHICMYPLHIQSPMQSNNARQVMIEIGQIYDIYYIR